MQLLDLLDREQFSVAKEEKQAVLTDLLTDLHQWHMEHSVEYRKITERVFGARSQFHGVEDIPFLPVSIFKNHAIKSVGDSDVYKVLTSSGTTGQQVSRIYLDKDTAKLQTLALSKIISHVLGNNRLPMLIVDSKSVLTNKASFSARGAGILGLSVFGKDHTYCLNDQFEPDEDLLGAFLAKYDGQPIFIFGFTFMIWQYLYKASLKHKYDLSKAILVHSGGWKKLKDIAVDNDSFRAALGERFGISQIYNFYGMVEQVGSVFLENSEGYLHCPNFADIIIRDPVDFSVQKPGKEGLIQVVSVLPKSYPGHSLLTEDIGVQMGEDNAGNGWKGKYFKILGRAKKAELRGCSDTFKSN